MRIPAVVLGALAASLSLAADALSIPQQWEISCGSARAPWTGQWGFFPSPFDPPRSEIQGTGMLLFHGQEFPLPVYVTDGTPAAMSELYWIVRPSTAIHGTCASEATGRVTIEFDGRRLVMDPATCPDGSPNSVWVDVFAFRAPAPVGVGHTTFGSVKSAYR